MTGSDPGFDGPAEGDDRLTPLHPLYKVEHAVARLGPAGGGPRADPRPAGAAPRRPPPRPRRPAPPGPERAPAPSAPLRL